MTWVDVVSWILCGALACFWLIGFRHDREEHAVWLRESADKLKLYHEQETLNWLRHAWCYGFRRHDEETDQEFIERFRADLDI